MKKLLLLFNITFFSIFITFGATRENTLKIYNWADYISPEVLENFPKWYKQHTGKDIEIIYNTFDINESMLTQIEIGQEDYDVICPSEYIIDKLLKNNLLLKIDKSIVPDSINYFNNVSPFVVNKFRELSNTVDVNEYAVGYMWGTTGWLYNKDKVDIEEVKSWSIINNSKYKNQIFMKDAYRDVYSVIVLYAYYDDIISEKLTRKQLIQNIKQEYIDSVTNILINCKENIKGWEVDFGKEEMIKGNAALNLSWSGDAQWAIQEAKETNVRLGYIVPIEGTNVWFDGWCIPKYAVNTYAATYFIDYLCESNNAIKNMEELGYVSVIATTEIIEWAKDTTFDYIDLSYFFGKDGKNMQANNVLYPNKTVIERATIMTDASDKIDSFNNMWTQVKGDNLSNTKIIILVVLLSLCICLYVYKTLKNKKYKKH